MKKFLIFVVLFIIGLSVIIYPYWREIFQFSAESIIKKNLPPYVAVKEITFDLKEGTLKVEDLKIKNPPGYSSRYLATVGLITCKYEMKGENILDGIKVTSIVASKPLIAIERLPNGRINTNEMDKVMGTSKPSKPALPVAKKEAPKGGRKISDLVELPSKIKIRNGKLTFLDRMITPKPYSIAVEKVNGPLDIGLSDDYRKVVSVGSRGTGFLNGDTRQKIQWVTSLDPEATALTMANKYEVTDIDITLFKPYYDEFSPVVIQKGRCSGTLVFNFDNGNIGSTNTLHLRGFVFQEKTGGRGSEYWVGTVSEVVKYLESAPGEIVFDFKIKGPMDSPRFYPGPHVKAAIQNMVVDKISDVIQGLDKDQAAQAGTATTPAQKTDTEKVVDIIKSLMQE